MYIVTYILGSKRDKFVPVVLKYLEYNIGSYTVALKHPLTLNHPSAE